MNRCLPICRSDAACIRSRFTGEHIVPTEHNHARAHAEALCEFLGCAAKPFASTLR